MRISELAERLGLRFEGDGEREIRGAAALESAGEEEITFAGPKLFPQARTSPAGCLIVPPEYENPGHQTLLFASNPRGIFAAALSLLFPAPAAKAGIHPTAVIDPSAVIDATAEIGPHVSIGAGSRVEAHCIVGPGTRIADDVRICASSRLHANVTIYSHVLVGSGAILHSGCVLGADGFGFVMSGGRYEKFPQVGRVELGPNVEIGANATVDRAALGVTLIGEGTKLDNMVHIGHNCQIGKHVVIAAQTGLSGGVVVGDYAVIGGQVGIGDKARIESRAILGSGSGVLTSKIVHGGKVLWGTPARPLKEYLGELAHLKRLPALKEEVTALKKRLAELEAKQ